MNGPTTIGALRAIKELYLKVPNEDLGIIIMEVVLKIIKRKRYKKIN